MSLTVDANTTNATRVALVGGEFFNFSATQDVAGTTGGYTGGTGGIGGSGSTSTLTAGQVLGSLTSPDGRFQFVYRSDGNIVLSQGSTVIWSSGTSGTGFAVMQGDGNFVKYFSDGSIPWHTNTVGHPGAWLAVENDGRAVIHDIDGSQLWSNDSGGSGGGGGGGDVGHHTTLWTDTGTIVGGTGGQGGTNVGALGGQTGAIGYQNGCHIWAQDVYPSYRIAVLVEVFIDNVKIKSQEFSDSGRVEGTVTFNVPFTGTEQRGRCDATFQFVGFTEFKIVSFLIPAQVPGLELTFLPSVQTAPTALSCNGVISNGSSAPMSLLVRTPANLIQNQRIQEQLQPTCPGAGIATIELNLDARSRPGVYTCQGGIDGTGVTEAKYVTVNNSACDCIPPHINGNQYQNRTTGVGFYLDIADPSLWQSVNSWFMGAATWWNDSLSSTGSTASVSDGGVVPIVIAPIGKPGVPAEYDGAGPVLRIDPGVFIPGAFPIPLTDLMVTLLAHEIGHALGASHPQTQQPLTLTYQDFTYLAACTEAQTIMYPIVTTQHFGLEIGDQCFVSSEYKPQNVTPVCR